MPSKETLKPFTAAVVQAASVAFDTPKTLEKLGDLAARAAGEGAKIAVFPEAFVGGYPKGMDFGTKLGMRTDEGRDWFRRYHEGGIDVPGPGVDFLSKVAKSNKIHMVVGVIERDGGTLYCTVLFFDDNGVYLGKHRKLMPTALERILWGFGDGSTLPVFDTKVGKLGAVICWENNMPLLRTAMYGKNIELYCAPTVDDREVWIPSMRHIAFEGRCFVLTAVQFATRGDYPKDGEFHDGDNPASVLINGGSAIISPLGDMLGGPVYGKETIVSAEIDLADIPRAKFDLDVVGHYARPDVFRLEVNEEPMPPVKFSKVKLSKDNK